MLWIYNFLKNLNRLVHVHVCASYLLHYKISFILVKTGIPLPYTYTWLCLCPPMAHPILNLPNALPPSLSPSPRHQVTLETLKKLPGKGGIRSEGRGKREGWYERGKTEGNMREEGGDADGWGCRCYLWCIVTQTRTTYSCPTRVMLCQTLIFKNMYPTSHMPLSHFLFNI